MTTFRWTDGDGVTQELASHDKIEQEWRMIRQHLLDLRTRLESADDAIFMAAHADAATLRSRLSALQDDLCRFARHEAARALTMIDQIELDASFVRALHRSYEQHRDRRGDDSALAASPTPDQMTVLRRQAIRDRTEASTPATFGEAHAQILAHPATCRMPLPETMPAFEWADRHMHHHQVRDLRQIEQEYVTVAAELVSLRPQLMPDASVKDMLSALEHSRLAVERVSILERNMNCWTAHVIGTVRGEYVTFLNDLEKANVRNV